VPSHPLHPASPSLQIPGTALTLPSPFHFQLHVVTRLCFNEQGRVTQHRDFWDVKDVIGLVPGVSLAQWIGTRLAAKGISCMSNLLSPKKTHQNPSTSAADDLEVGIDPGPNALGLEGV